MLASTQRTALIDGARRAAYAVRVFALLTTSLVAFAPDCARAAFEDTLGGAMSFGMAGAHVALVEDTESIAVNPAGLAGLKLPEGTRQLSVDYGGLYLGLSDGNRIKFPVVGRVGYEILFQLGVVRCLSFGRAQRGKRQQEANKSLESEPAHDQTDQGLTPFSLP
mgnify:CR=1 FL=1